MEFKDLIDFAQSLPQPEFYQNSCKVVEISGIALNLWETILAALIGQLNILLIGEKGDGKTQLMQEINDKIFGGKGSYFRGHPEFDVKKIFETLNLSKISEGKGRLKDAKELTEVVEHPFSAIDEINRVPPITQNQFLNMCDHYLELEGKKIFLGKRGYHAVVATANLGREYRGVFDFDEALLDRFHLILDLNNFRPTTSDGISIFAKCSPPHIKEGKKENHLKEIIILSEAARKAKLSKEGLLSLVFLEQGVDFCQRNEQNHSKLAIKSEIPTICEGCHLLGGWDCGYVFPLSYRSALSLILLAFGMKIMAAAKTEEKIKEEITAQEIFQAYFLSQGYKGVIDRQWVRQKHAGNILFAMEKVSSDLKKKFEEKLEIINHTFLEAREGKISQESYDQFKEEWEWCREIIENILEEKQKWSQIF